MLLGILSDTHGELPEGVYDAFKGVDYIIHAGDIGRESVLWELEYIAPTFACLGNNDWQNYGSSVRREMHPSVGGMSIAVTHFPHEAERLARTGDYGLVVHGHTHVPRDEMLGACRIINPGSTTRPRKGSARQCCTLRVSDGVLGPLTAHLL